MSYQVVPTLGTPVSLAALKAAITAAFTAEGRPLTPTQVVNLTVLAAIETGQGGSMKNYNVGNITASARYGGQAWRPPWYHPPGPEAPPRLRKLHAAMLAGQAPSAFRAYLSLEEGARDYARQLIRTFPEVLAAANQTDPNVLRLALGQKYSRDYLTSASTTRTIGSLQQKLGLAAAGGAAGAGGAAVLALLGWLTWRFLRA